MAKKEIQEGVQSEADSAAAPSSSSNGAIAEIIQAIEKLSVLDLADLVKQLEDKFGVSAAAPVAFAAPAGDDASAGGAVEEQTEFAVVLTGFGEKKIQVIKVVREITSLGLKEAKELVDGVPKPVREGVAKEEAEELIKKLEDAGATAELK